MKKVRTFATAFERESRWRWQTGRAEATGESADRCTEYLTLRMCKGARKDKPHAFWKPSKNFFFEKKTSKKFGGYKKAPYLCKRFPAETGAWKKDSSLKDFG